MATDLVIEVDNEPGSLARVAAAISDAGVNLAAATFHGPHGELHILVPHAEPVRHALALTHQTAIAEEREVCVVEIDDDRPGVLADLTREIADAGINLDLVYVATHNRVVLGSQDLDKLKLVLGQA